MKKRQKEIQQQFLDSEKAVLKKLEYNYKIALADIDKNLEALMARNDADMQNVIYRIEHQKALKTQVQAILEQLQANEFQTVSEYLTEAYTDGFVGAMYDMHGQEVPLIVPIDQEQVVDAIKHDTKLSEDLYTSLGKDIKVMNRQIAGEISRGIAAGMGFGEIARNIANYTNIPKNNAMRIARTESHRIQCRAACDAQFKAKEKGADVLKQWDAYLDGKTRDSHRELDGQIRELEELFEVNGHKAMYPGDFGRPEEDINCRCAIKQRARWNLGEAELQKLKERAEYFGLDKTEQFEDFKKKYLKASEFTDEEDVLKAIKKKFRDSVNKINEHQPVKLLDLKSEYATSIIAMFEDAPTNIKRINDKYADSIKFINEKVVGSASTGKKGISVNLKNDSKNIKGAWTSTFHEIGHAIEIKSGNIAKKYPTFKKLLEDDFYNVVNSYQKMYNKTKNETLGIISNALCDEKLHSVSDLIGGITNNKCYGLYTHDEDYWKKPYKLEKEAFAHFYEATARKDSAKLKAIKEMFPNAYAEFERMVDEI